VSVEPADNVGALAAERLAPGDGPVVDDAESAGAEEACSEAEGVGNAVT
jgi:hypothetical protein